MNPPRLLQDFNSPARVSALAIGDVIEVEDFEGEVRVQATVTGFRLSPSTAGCILIEWDYIGAG